MPETITVTGMSCDGCEANVEEALSEIADLSVVDIDHTADSVTVEGKFEPAEIRAAIQEAGYETAL